MQRDREEKPCGRCTANARERADFGVGKLAAFLSVAVRFMSWRNGLRINASYKRARESVCASA